MRTRLIKGAMGVALAVAALSGCTAAEAATTVPVATTAAWFTLPACDDDAPDPALTVPCVWEDDGTMWVMDGKGGSQDYPLCVTEDSVRCVWDAATQGNRSADVDAQDRYTVNP